jgi:hypothetical protein
MPQFLRKKDITPAILCNLLALELHGSAKASSVQLSRFRGYRGPMQGAASNIFYAAYVFFEKLRLRDDKEKTSDRLTMEEKWAGRGGFTRVANQSFICKIGSRPYYDQWGDVHFPPGS